MVATKVHIRNPAQTARRARAAMKHSEVQPEYISRAEGVALLDRQARKYLGMSGQEFRDKFRSGELTYDDHPDVVRVAMIIPLAEN